MGLDGRVMPYNFLAYDERQMYLLPASIVEWVKNDSLARFVGETWEGVSWGEQRFNAEVARMNLGIL